MDELRRIIGQEQPLDQFHMILRRAASRVSGVSAYGSCLVTCSDERQGLTRNGFDRDVASPLISDVTNAKDRVFAVSNLCGRLEPGGFALVDDHFSRPEVRGRKMLVMEIASHVGRIKHNTEHVYGQIERFGRSSACCGALSSLLNPQQVTDAVRHPWFEQLNSFFGPVRLEALRALDDSTRMVAAAIVHAALQAESTIAEVFYDAPTTPTDVLLVAGVSINQQWADGFLPVAYHHLRANHERIEILSGFSLRTTPEALSIDLSRARIHVEGGHGMEQAPRVQRRVAAASGEPGSGDTPLQLPDIPAEHREALEQRLDAVRDQIEVIRQDPAAWRTYSRPILRGLFRGLTVVEPNLGLAALLYEGGEELFAQQKLKQILDHGPATAEGRRALHDIEAELQQLNHEDAQQVLDVLLAERSVS